MYRIMFFPGNISGGVGAVVMNIFRNIDNNRFIIDFCVPETDKGYYDQEILAKNGHVFHVPLIKKVGPLKYMRIVKDILIKNGPYDAIHVHSVHMGALAILSAKKAGINKRIYHVHNTKDAALDHLPFHNVLEKYLKKSIIKNSNVYLACGQKAGQYIYGNVPFTIINNAVDLVRFYPYSYEKQKEIRDSLSITPNKYVVGNIARFSTVKNQKRLVDIACLDKTQRDMLVFLLVGDGETLSDVKKYANEKKCLDKIIFTGIRNDSERMYNTMDVFCLPSYFEGLPVTMIEAQACGIPCLVSDVITQECSLGISDVMFLSLEENNQKWLDALYSLVNSRVNEKKYIERILIQKRYEIHSIVKQLEEIYLFNIKGE